MRSISCDKSNNIGCNGQSLKVPFIRFEFQGPAAFVSDRAIPAALGEKGGCGQQEEPQHQRGDGTHGNKTRLQAV